MLNSAIPTKMPTAWGASAGGGFIRTVPIPSQIGTNPGFASFTDGFPPLCFSPVGAGGVPPFGQDMNGALNAVTKWLQWAQAGGVAPFDSTFSGLIGGYPQNAIIASGSLIGNGMTPAGATVPRLFQSLVDNNTNDPASTPENWNALGLAEVGDFKWRPTAENLPGWIIANASTIGSAASGATQLAAQRAFPLYNWLWTNFSQAQCPVTGGRGGTSALDFYTNNKPIAVYDMRGYGANGMDTMGGSATTRLNGVPAVSGSATTAGSVLGEALHALATGELAVHNHGTTEAAHTHSYNSVGGTSASSGGAIQANPAGATTGATSTGLTINNAGSGTAHNNTSLVVVGTWYIKL